MWIYFLVVGIGSVGYYFLIRNHTGRWNSTFAGFWLLSGGVHLSLFFAYPKFPESVHIGIGVLTLAGWGLFAWIESLILCTAKKARDFSGEAAYVIILGAQVRGSQITKSLKQRLDRAYEYLTEHPEAIAIVSGGQGKDEAVTEAFAMAEYLKSLGIAEKRILKEEQSETTWENLKFSAGLIGSLEQKTAVVTNDFHLYRALLIGRQIGYRDLNGIAAISDPVLKLNYLVREFAAVLLTKVKSML